MKQARELSEKHLTIQVIQALSWQGWRVFKTHEMPYCPPAHDGISDLIAIKSGITVYIELKGPKAQWRPKQKLFKQAIEEAGGLYIGPAYKLEEVEAALEKLWLIVPARNGQAAFEIKITKGMQIKTEIEKGKENHETNKA